jgi:carboxyl-terminal processing protease
MLAGLDPHSGYMDAREYREMQLESAGNLGGIGIEVAPRNGVITVVTPLAIRQRPGPVSEPAMS